MPQPFILCIPMARNPVEKDGRLRNDARARDAGGQTRLTPARWNFRPYSVGLALSVLALLGATKARAAHSLPPGFDDPAIFSGLTQPTAVRFSPDGRIFVAEKRGLIKVFDGLTDTTPAVFADLQTNVHNFWDRGLLGLALDPNFPGSPYVYVLYTYDFDINTPGTPAPRRSESTRLNSSH